MQAHATEPLRVLVDARKLIDGGIGVYTRNLIEGVLESSPRSAMQLGVLGDPQIISGFDWAGEVEVVEERARPYSFDEMVGLPRRLRGQFAPHGGYHLFHAPHYTLPFGIPVPTVVTVHDLIHVTHPERRYYPHIARTLIRSAVRRATHVVTVSEATRRELCQLVQSSRAAEKISVLPNAVDPYFRETAIRPDYPQQRFGVGRRYLLCVASMLKPHKGIADLIAAVAELQLAIEGMFPDGLEFVLVGQGTDDTPALRRLLRENERAKPHLRVLGRVSREELLQLYAGALALVVPSLAEGFCLPVIEAQSAGTPVIARPVPAILELLTDQDRVAADFSEAAFRSSLLSFLEEVTRGEDPRTSSSALRQTTARYDRFELGRAWQQLYLNAAGRPARAAAAGERPTTTLVQTAVAHRG